MQKRAKNNKAFQKEQQNNPNSENQKFDSSKFAKISHTQMPKLDYIYMFIDAKGDSEQGDFCGILAGGVSIQTQKLYIFLSKQERIKGKPVVTKVVNMLKEIKVYMLGGDKNGGFYMLRDWIKDACFQQNVPTPLMKFTHWTENKEDRMGELEFPIDDGDIVFVGDHTELFNQMDDFPESEHDDLHDPLSAVYRMSKLRRMKKDANSSGKRTNTRGTRHKRQSSNTRTRSRR
jgi:phage terminase large subunit-like protein